jgi:hypothetical protein
MQCALVSPISECRYGRDDRITVTGGKTAMDCIAASSIARN